MSIKEKTIKILWSNAAGVCSFKSCDKKLTTDGAEGIPAYTIGEMAHIKGNRPGSNRHDPTQSQDDRDDYKNLILLCPTHHTEIDKPENEKLYSIEVLYEMKKEHENFISNRLNTMVIDSLEDLKDHISIYLSENHQAWEHYGPLSENARKFPNDESIYALWITERLSTIVPNNRTIEKLLQDNRYFIPRKNQNLVSKFIQHVESYEKWVNDEITYHAIQKFPEDFESFILGE